MYVKSTLFVKSVFYNNFVVGKMGHAKAKFL